MQPSETLLLRLSQRELSLLETCPRKFQHIYFDRLTSPINPEHQEKQNLGSRFHLLMQQRELGLPVESLCEEEPKLQQWMTALVSATPGILTPDSEKFRESEHRRTLNLQGYLLTVIYDLLIADNEVAQILDWKTYPQPKQREGLENNWQTRLYLYVLAESSDYLPKQITMTYWFVQSQPKPKSLKFSYGSRRHEQTRKDLTRILTQLTDWLQRYQDKGEDFPQVPEPSRYCQDCTFRERCDRAGEPSNTTPFTALSNLADIQEVPL